MKKRRVWLLTALTWIALALSACGGAETEPPEESVVAEANAPGLGAPEAQPPVEEETPEEEKQSETPPSSEGAFSLSGVEPYTDQAYVPVNGNQPYFSENDLTAQSYEYYSDLDELGRCGVAHACIGVDLMPTEDRESISQVKPTGWINVKYDNVDGKYLYNRCHLIGFQLSGENANEKNLITGTRYLNVDGMLPYENMIADYVKETENHVMYRVTPVFEGDNLVASGVLLEAQSVEDQGEDIEFCVYVYNVQPGIEIDYATGESRPADGSEPEVQADEPAAQARSEETAQEAPEIQDQDPAPQVRAEAAEPESEVAEEPVPQGTDYILNTNTGKFHYPDCSSVDQMKESNKLPYTGSRDDVIAQGYDPCKRCKP